MRHRESLMGRDGSIFMENGRIVDEILHVFLRYSSSFGMKEHMKKNATRVIDINGGFLCASWFVRIAVQWLSAMQYVSSICGGQKVDKDRFH